MSESQQWGRVDETRTVYVRTREGERAVGQFPDGTNEEALAFFERRYTDLASQVGLLEVRTKKGAPVNEISKTVKALREKIINANAVGDLEGLLARLEALDSVTAELSEAQKIEHQAEVDKAIVVRRELVEKVEALAGKDPAKTQWKQASAELEEIFAEWQRQQQGGPRLPKLDANTLWTRFRTARTKFEQQRRAYFNELDTSHKEAATVKERIIVRAEALAKRGVEALPDYRNLLEEWKKAPRSGRKTDDALWTRFKAAGDVLYAAKAEIDAKDNVEFAENLEKKKALLVEAEPLLLETDPKQARKTLNRIQRQWDEIGKVPRDAMRTIDDKLAKIETHIRGLEADHWTREDPEKKARSEGMLGQLHDAIEKLNAEIAAAKKSGDKKALKEAEEALAARKEWLKALGG